jgi:hypothetical protein
MLSSFEILSTSGMLFLKLTQQKYFFLQIFLHVFYSVCETFVGGIVGKVKRCTIFHLSIL